MLTRAVFAAVGCAIATTAVVTAAPAHAASAIQFGKVQYDSPGTDTGSNYSLTSEYIVIKNTGTTTRSLTGWTVRDAANHVYKFGTFSLGAGKSVYVRTGSGTNNSGSVYWGSTAYIWNNTGDQAWVRDAVGTHIDYCAWTSTGVGYKTCL